MVNVMTHWKFSSKEYTHCGFTKNDVIFFSTQALFGRFLNLKKKTNFFPFFLKVLKI